MENTRLFSYFIAVVNDNVHVTLIKNSTVIKNFLAASLFSNLLLKFSLHVFLKCFLIFA